MQTEPSTFDYMIMPFKKYADFSGRARRKEYWLFTLFVVIIYFLLAAVGGFVAGSLGAGGGPEEGAMIGMIPLGIFILAIIIPSIAVLVRRLHDTGRSGWWALLNLVPIASLVLFVFTLLESEEGTNKWGPNPKNLNSELETIDHLISED